MISIHVVGTIEPNIEVVDNIDRYLIDCETIKNCSEFVKESLLHG